MRALRFFTFLLVVARSIPSLRVVKGPQCFLRSRLEPLGMLCRVTILTIRAKRNSRIASVQFVLEAMVKDPACLRVPQVASAHQGHERCQGPAVQLEVPPQERLVDPKLTIRCEGHPRRGITNIMGCLAPEFPPVLHELRINHIRGMLVQDIPPLTHRYTRVHGSTRRISRRRDVSQGGQSVHTDLLVPLAVALHGH